MEGNQVRIAYRAAGSSDNWKIIRRTNDALTAGAETVRSEEVRSDRKRGGQKIVTLTVGGTVDFEFSATTFDDLIAAAMCNTWATDTPSAGTDQLAVGTTTTKFDVLKSYLDSGDHVLMKNMEVGQLSFTMNSGERITGQISFMGTEADTTYDPSTDTFDPATTTLIMDSSNSLANINIDGSTPSAVITGMSLDINNNHQSDQEIASQFQAHFKGSADITGSMTFRFTTDAFTLFENTLDNTPISFAFDATDGTNTYNFSAGKTFLAGDLPSGGLDSILSMELNTVVATDGSGEMLVITRS